MAVMQRPSRSNSQLNLAARVPAGRAEVAEGNPSHLRRLFLLVITSLLIGEVYYGGAISKLVLKQTSARVFHNDPSLVVGPQVEHPQFILPDGSKLQAVVETPREGPPGRISFLFLAYSCFYLEPVWLKYFEGVPRDQFSIVVHHDGLTAPAGKRGLDVKNLTSTFAAFSGMFDAYNIGGGKEAREATRITYIPVTEPSARFSNALAISQYEAFVEAHKDKENECFVLVSDTTVPLLSFKDLRALWLDENGKCRRSSAILTEKTNCGQYLTKSSTWAVLPRAQVDMMAAADREYVMSILLDIRSFLKYGKAHGYKYYNDTCSTERRGAIDEFMIPTLLSTLYTLPENAERAVLHKESSWNRNYSTIVYWFEGRVPEILLKYCINCGRFAQARVGGGHPIAYDIHVLVDHKLEDLQRAVHGEFVRKLVNPAVQESIMKDVSIDRQECTRLALLFDANQLVYK